MTRDREPLRVLHAEVVACRRCPRLVTWREEAAAHPPARARGEVYWARPVPGFGDPRARLVVVGLAPAAHGGNRTGRFFTGDRSGEWLFRALHKAGFASQPTSLHRDDGLRLRDCYVTAAVRCAPPANRPTTEEREACRSFLVRELASLRRARVLAALGAIAWDALLRVAGELGAPPPSPRPRFAHGAELALGPWVLLASYHPSQQNTFTGRLTEPQLDAVWTRARALLAGARPAPQGGPWIS